MSDHELAPKRHPQCDAKLGGSASAASVGAALCSIYPLDAACPPGMLAALTALSDHPDDRHKA